MVKRHQNDTKMKKAIFKLKLRTDHENIDGSSSICIYFKGRGSQRNRIISTHFKCKDSDWSLKDQEYKQNVKDSFHLNKQLNAIKKACNTIIDNYFTSNKLLTFQKFKQELYFKDQPTDNVFDYIQTVIQRKKPRLKASSLRNYDLFYNKLLLMVPDRELYFHEIDLNFIQRLDKYLLDHKNNKNTTCRKHKTFQVIINHALKDGLLKSDPYQFFNKGTIKGTRHFLTEIEFKKLRELYNSKTLPDPEQNALRMFMFMSMTGLRISDLLNLRHSNIISELDGSGNVSKMIDISQIKTGNQNTVPLSQGALDILSFCNSNSAQGEYIFKEYRNPQNINYRLKFIAKKAGIKKNLTNHIARHTFATIALNKGMKFETVSKILGHTDLKTTSIYAKLLNSTKIDEMQKLNDIF